GRGDHALGGEAFGINLARARMISNRAIHQRLGEGRLVALVMAMAAIAEDVDDLVLLETVAKLRRDARDIDERFGIIAIHMKDRRLDFLCDLGAIGTGTRISGARGEADLVVDDDMDRAAGAIAFELR